MTPLPRPLELSPCKKQPTNESEGGERDGTRWSTCAAQGCPALYAGLLFLILHALSPPAQRNHQQTLPK